MLFKYSITQPPTYLLVQSRATTLGFGLVRGGELVLVPCSCVCASSAMLTLILSFVIDDRKSSLAFQLTPATGLFDQKQCPGSTCLII
jgi:hypothetical protein